MKYINIYMYQNNDPHNIEHPSSVKTSLVDNEYFVSSRNMYIKSTLHNLRLGNKYLLLRQANCI